ncbi:hypothetical protein EJ08DRAFT_682825 [Tothia fuscella]|uniref:BTB domain-containing protein n=1 Tax=Tothia fuscella TaxID=1048955 RepID=A0A9P4NHR8_9PEZI|nr:hypothetical protein EJ08DRAFT_682825 [Tothia fuscella]
MNTMPLTEEYKTKIAMERFSSYVAGLDKFWKSGQHSDLVLACPSGTTFNVHKTVLCSQSAFFEKACTPSGFKESVDGIVKVGYEDDLVKAVLQYCYTMDYDAKDDMLFHAKMYSVADYYGIPALKPLALTKFEEVARCSDPNITATIEHIYNNTPEEDRSLRDVLVRVCMTKDLGSLLLDDAFATVFATIIEFRKDLALLLVGASRWIGWKKVQCQRCQHIWADTRETIGNATCPCCGDCLYQWDNFAVF